MNFIYFYSNFDTDLLSLNIYNINKQLIEFSDIIRAIFFISNQFRKYNNCYIIAKNYILEINGQNIRNLRPDQINILKYFKKIIKIFTDYINNKNLDENIKIRPGISIFNHIDFLNFIQKFKDNLLFHLMKKGSLKELINIDKEKILSSVIFINKNKNLKKLKSSIIGADLTNKFNSNLSTKILIFNYLLVDNKLEI